MDETTTLAPPLPSNTETNKEREDRVERQRVEWLKSSDSLTYFLFIYGRIEIDVDGTGSFEWHPFELWPAQYDVANAFQEYRKVIVLKARQLGLTWLALGLALWLIVFRPASRILLFSRREIEARDVLLHRLKGMYKRLPSWMRCHVLLDSATRWELGNGSSAHAFPTSAGDSYTAAMVLIDEADLLLDLDKLMRSTKPTIDAGGRILLISRSDKSRPQSTFKAIYRGAKRGANDYTDIFLGWDLRPGRTQEWYEEQERDSLTQVGTLDAVHEQYPATDAQALAPSTLGKRIPGKWLDAVYTMGEAIDTEPLVLRPGTKLDIDLHALAVQGNLVMYAASTSGETYVIGGDPAEGNPNSDPSAGIVMSAVTGSEVAYLSGQFEPDTFADILSKLSQFYNNASILVERNNHGHAVLLGLRNRTANVKAGFDGKLGWLSNGLGKSMMYTETARMVKERVVSIYSEIVYYQLQSIESGTLKAPEGEHDDGADGFALCCAALSRPVAETPPTSSVSFETF